MTTLSFSADFEDGTVGTAAPGGPGDFTDYAPDERYGFYTTGRGGGVGLRGYSTTELGGSSLATTAYQRFGAISDGFYAQTGTATGDFLYDAPYDGDVAGGIVGSFGELYIYEDDNGPADNGGAFTISMGGSDLGLGAFTCRNNLATSDSVGFQETDLTGIAAGTWFSLSINWTPTEVGFLVVRDDATVIVDFTDPISYDFHHPLGVMRGRCAPGSHSEWRMDNLTLTVSNDTTAPVVTFAPPLRLTNRDDVFSSVPSLVRNRSRQGSNRLTGYL